MYIFYSVTDLLFTYGLYNLGRTVQYQVYGILPSSPYYILITLLLLYSG